MTRKQIGFILMLVVVISAVTGLVGYRSGLRKASSGIVTSLTSSNTSGPCLSIDGVSSHTGETVCVAGRVLRVFTSSAGNTFLDFCPDFRQCPFTAVVFSADRNKFGDLQTLAGRQVEIRGLIAVYRGRPEIIVSDPKQIAVVR